MRYKIGDAFVDMDGDYLVIVSIDGEGYNVYYPGLDQCYCFELNPAFGCRQLSKIEELLFIP